MSMALLAMPRSGLPGADVLAQALEVGAVAGNGDGGTADEVLASPGAGIGLLVLRHGISLKRMGQSLDHGKDAGGHLGTSPELARPGQQHLGDGEVLQRRAHRLVDRDVVRGAVMVTEGAVTSQV